MNNIKDILELSNINVREYTQYSIDSDVKQLFIDAFQMVDKTVGKYEHLPEYDQIIDWLKNNDGKGLFLAGSVGRGKSVIVNGVIPLLFRAIHNKVLHPVPARLLHKSPLYWAACIDDVGQDVMINDFGTKVFSVDNVISDCEDNMKLLIMSSNLTKDQLSDKYGDRIVDRINRLCKLVVFKGKSLRK